MKAAFIINLTAVRDKELTKLEQVSQEKAKVIEQQYVLEYLYIFKTLQNLCTMHKKSVGQCGNDNPRIIFLLQHDNI